MSRCFGVSRPSLVVWALVLGFVLTARAQARSGQTKDDHPRFPPGEGRDLTLRVCSQCHSADTAADQELDAAGWQDLVNQMVETGAEMTPQEYDQIVRYLSKAFPPAK